MMRSCIGRIVKCTLRGVGGHLGSGVFPGGLGSCRVFSIQY